MTTTENRTIPTRTRRRSVDTRATAITLWGRDQHRRNLSERTITDQRGIVLRLQRWLGADALTAQTHEIEAWLDSCSVGPSGRATYLKALRSFYAFASAMGLTESDPVKAIRNPKVPRGMPRPITKDDLSFALSQATPKLKAWLCLAAFEGLRAAEIAGLRVEHLLLDRPDPLLLVQHGKGDKMRVIPLNPVAERALRAAGLPRAGYVFANGSGRPPTAGWVSGQINRFLHDLDIPATCHAGRHYFGTEVYRRTRDIRLVQTLLGHASLQTTQIYAAFDPDGADVVRDLGTDLS